MNADVTVIIATTCMKNRGRNLLNAIKSNKGFNLLNVYPYEVRERLVKECYGSVGLFQELQSIHQLSF